jgi:hypothetical protein
VLHGPGPDPGDLACATVELVDAAERRVFADPAQWTSDGERLGEGERLCIAVDPEATAWLGGSVLELCAGVDGIADPRR